MTRRSLYPSWEAYLNKLVPRLLQLAAAVHDEGPDEVRRLVMQARRGSAPAGVDPVEGVIVGLAALVDVTRTPAELFAEIDALVPRPQLAWGRRPSRAVFRPQVVAAVIEQKAPFGVLRARERGQVVLAWQRMGVLEEEIMRRTGQQTKRHVRRMAARAAGRAA